MDAMTMCSLVGVVVSWGVLVPGEEIVLEAEQPSAGKWRWGDFVPRARPLETASGGQIIVLERGDWLEYRFTVPEEGNYEVIIATGGNDTRQAGRLFLDGGPEVPVEDARDRLDLDTPATAEDRHQRELIVFTQPLGVVHLAAGGHTLRVEHAGREGFSSAFGVDCVKLRPTQAEATLQAGDRREGTTDFRQEWQFDGGPPPSWWREEELFGHTEGRWDPALAGSPIRVFFGGYPADDPASYAAANAAGKTILHYVSFMTHCHLPRAQTASRRDPQFLEYWSLVDHPEWRLVNEQGLTVNVFMPEYQASTIRELCLNAPGAMEACLNLARAFMEAGAGGIFVDNVHPSTHCHGPEFGRHEHVYPDQNNQECLHRLLSRLRRLVKSYGEDKLVMLNSGGPNAYYADVGDALMWESYAYTYTEGGQRVLNPAAIRAAADYWRHYVDEEGGVIAALSYIQADARHSERENAFYAYVGAKLSHFHWMGSGAPELQQVRLGRPLAYIEDIGPLWVRRYENGLVAMNPTGEAVEQALPWPWPEGPWDLFAGEPLALQGGQFTVQIPPESGRVYVPVNLLVNPRLEGTAAPWRTWPRRGQPEFAYDTTVGHGDATSLRIAALAEGVDGAWVQGLACEGGTPYDYSFWFRTDPPGGTVSFLAEFGAADGAYAGQHRREIKAAGAEWTRAEGSFFAPPQAVNVQFEVWVNLDNVGQGTAWFDDFSLQFSTRPLVEMVLAEPLHRLLQPGDGPIRFHLAQTNRRAPAVRYIAELRAGEQVLEERAGRLTDQAVVVIPTQKMIQDGLYMLSVKAELENEVIFQTDETLVRRADPPRVGIGPYRELLVDGQPFFPIGVYWTRKEDLPDLPGNGFNCTHAWLYPNEEARAFLDEAQRVGLRVVLEMSDTLRGQTALEQIRERVEFFRQEPTLLCYYPVDEPFPPHTDPAGMHRAYNLIKALDPDHPVMHVQYNMAYLGTYIGATDIMAVDPYGPPDLVQQWMGLASAASEHRKPVWAVIGAFPWEAFGGLPTPEYVRAATYVALISGAKGVLYFSYHFDQHNLKQSVLWEPLGRLNGEIAQLGRWLLAGEPTPVEASDSRVLAATFADGNSRILLAVNKSEAEAVEAELQLPGVRGEARGLFEDATMPCEGKVTVHLPPYGTAALKLPIQEAE